MAQSPSIPSSLLTYFVFVLNFYHNVLLLLSPSFDSISINKSSHIWLSFVTERNVWCFDQTHLLVVGMNKSVACLCFSPLFQPLQLVSYFNEQNDSDRNVTCDNCSGDMVSCLNSEDRFILCTFIEGCRSINERTRSLRFFSDSYTRFFFLKTL